MGLGFLFARVADISVTKKRVKRALYVAGALLCAMPFSGHAQTVPSFVRGTALNTTVCSNDSVDLSGNLAVSDPDAGQSLSWTITQPPAHGSIIINPPAPSSLSGSTNIPFPGTIFYKPDPTYNGPVTFQVQISDGVDGVGYLNVSVTEVGAPVATFTSFPSVCTGVTSTALMFTNDSFANVGIVTDTFNYFGLIQTFTVPVGVTSLDFAVYGAAGGRESKVGVQHAGRGGKITGTLSVSPNDPLGIYIGEHDPGPGNAAGGNHTFNGGGTSYDIAALSARGGFGGGASDIRLHGAALSNRVVVAGGGGGNGWNAVNGTCLGGDGGGTNGVAGCTNTTGSFAKPGTPVNGGAGANNSPSGSGQNGVISGGIGGDGSIDAISGGGGGGLFGGGGGAASGGAGGSSFANSSLTSGVQYATGDTDLNGMIIIKYLAVGTYSIDYDPTANSLGFVDMLNVFPLPAKANGFPITIPPGTAAGVYHATLTISNSICTTSYPFTITVKQTPNVVVNGIPSTPPCNGDALNVKFTSTLGSTPTYAWTNNNVAIGAPANGSGNISFTATNTGVGPLTSTFTVTPTESGCIGAPVNFAITVNPQPSLTVAGPGVACAGSTSASISFSNLVNVGTFSNTYSYLSGNTAPQVFTVPANVSSINYDVIAGNGGSDDQSLAPNPGKGGRIQGVINVNQFDNLNIYVGSHGFNGSPFGAAGGYNGGGNAIYYPGIGCGGAGGGASDIRLNGIALTDRIVVAGGGGGNGYDNPFGAYAGGDGGGLTGGNSATNIDGHFAGGGSQIAGGLGATFTSQIPGGNGGFGFGGDGSPQGVSGAGGGGFYGGGGGVWTGGGGGSSYSDPVITTLVNYTPGFNIGDGIVKISYTTVGTYDIVWTGATGFTNVTNATLSGSSFTFPIPAGATPQTYNGTLILHNGLCSNSFPISLIINATPDVIATPGSSQVLCNNDTTLAVKFTNTAASPTVKYIWTNDNTSIGLAAKDSVDIASFKATNTGNTGVVSNIVITPIQTTTGCIGAPVTFSYSVNPTPHLTNTTDTVCSDAPVGFIASSNVAGTTFNWTRPTWPSIANLAQPLTSGDINETLYNTTYATSVTVPYQYYLNASGCTDTEVVRITVKPIPLLFGSTNDTICSGTILNNSMIETALIPSTVYTWTVPYVSGSTKIPGTYTGTVNDTLGNISPNIIKVPYTFTLSADGCTNPIPQTVNIFVKPIPHLNSSTSIVSCSGSPIVYNATSLTPGTVFNWNRPNVTGVAEAGTPGVGNIGETLTNTTTSPVMVPYQYALSANGCSGTPDTVMLTLNPIPMMTSSLDTSVCSGAPFTYTATSSTPGAIFHWIRAAKGGVAPGTGGSVISGPLSDTATSPLVVPHWFTLSFASCTSFDTVNITVNPSAKFTSSKATIVNCDSVMLNYSPASSTAGASFAWSRAVVAGIKNTAATGSGDLRETLKNIENYSVNVVYVYTVTANGCKGDTASINVLVHPTPTLASTKTPAYTCTDRPFYYSPSSYVTGTTYKWDRFFVNGIYGDSVNDPTRRYYSTNFGTGDIYETLYDTDYVVHRVLYLYRLTANGCTNLTRDSVFVNVVPGPRLPAIVTASPLAPCSNTLFQTFSAAIPPGEGIGYNWYANNATIWSVTKDHQSAYVNFNFAGQAYVRLTGTTFSNGCMTRDSVFVNVSSGVADNLSLVYYQGQFVCLRSDMDTYQWGYDDIATFVSTTIPGATQQNLYLPNANMDRYRYWVITTHNGCTQKSYYNAPLGVNDVNADVTDIKLYPNPTNNYVNVEVTSTVNGDIQVELMNLLGQKLGVETAINHKATFNVANLPAGIYLVDCYREGVKIGTSRFVKN